jgi:hypothetical protein
MSARTIYNSTTLRKGAITSAATKNEKNLQTLVIFAITPYVALKSNGLSALQIFNTSPGGKGIKFGILHRNPYEMVSLLFPGSGLCELCTAKIVSATKRVGMGVFGGAECRH